MTDETERHPSCLAILASLWVWFILTLALAGGCAVAAWVVMR